jgi:hypothetical protein
MHKAVKAVHQRLGRNPKRLMRKMAKQMGMSKTYV